MQPLAPCPACRRHVLVTERLCPFCASVLPADFPSLAVPDAPRRLSRAAAFVFTTTLAAAGCSSTVASTDAGPADTSRTDAPTDQGPPGDTATPRDTGARDSGPPDDEGSILPEYGVPPPFDAGLTDTSTGNLYGVPPPPDAGPADTGSGNFLYGVPPPPDAG